MKGGHLKMSPPLPPAAVAAAVVVRRVRRRKAGTSGMQRWREAAAAAAEWLVVSVLGIWGYGDGDGNTGMGSGDGNRDGDTGMGTSMGMGTGMGIRTWGRGHRNGDGDRDGNMGTGRGTWVEKRTKDGAGSRAEDRAGIGWLRTNKGGRWHFPVPRHRPHASPVVPKPRAPSPRGRRDPRGGAAVAAPTPGWRRRA